jgi:hypothetical protein
MYTDFTGGVNAAPNRYFALLAPANTSRIVLNDTAQTVTFRWNAAVDLNGDNVIYQWLPIGFPAVPTGTAAKDTFLVRTGKQLLTYLSTSDSVVLKWAVAAKDPTNPAVASKDTLTVKLVRGTITGVDGLYEIPTRFALDQNYPNPFNPTTRIGYQVPSPPGQGGGNLGAERVRLVVYDLLGREVAVLVDEAQQPGTYQVTFDGANLSAGTYMYRLTAGSRAESQRMLLVK